MRERTMFPAEVLEKLTDIRLLVSTGPAHAAIDLSAAGRLGITVCGTGYVSDPTVEHTWALILAPQGTCSSGRTRSRRARTRQSWVIGCPNRTGVRYDDDRVESNLTPQKAAEHDVQAVTKEQLFAQSDLLSIHVALSERTRGLVGAAELQSMKPTAILVNTSRGPVLDEDASSTTC
jgi:lactate dehydrogenase-like 2-hydroxyacid dehydrogenase